MVINSTVTNVTSEVLALQMTETIVPVITILVIMTITIAIIGQVIRLFSREESLIGYSVETDEDDESEDFEDFDDEETEDEENFEAKEKFHKKPKVEDHKMKIPKVTLTEKDFIKSEFD